MSAKPQVKIGNAQGFWGDWPEAPARLVAQAPDLDYLTLDYLAEVSMSILAKQRERDPSAGYARDFLEVIASLAPTWRTRRTPKLITNAGGLNPAACAQAAAKILRDAGCKGMRIGNVTGDDVLAILLDNPQAFPHLENNKSLSTVLPSLVTANAYVGAAPVIDALARGADIVITGRVADPSLTVAPAAHQFGWRTDDYDRLAGATVAGHLIECGAQVTGGISTDWLDVPNPADIGYPIAEIANDGSCVITKPPNTGGRVDQPIVKEQLVYEIGDPANYISPDATVSFLSLRLEDDGVDRVRVQGAIGRPPPKTYKVSATYRAGYRASGMLTIFGRDAVTKARRCGEIILARLRQAGFNPPGSRVECLGAGDVVPGATTPNTAATEVVLRVSVYDSRREVVDRFTRELAPLVTGGPQGVTGYAEGRPAVREVFGYWPTLIDRSAVRTQVDILEV
jgi:hypothetical protein